MSAHGVRWGERGRASHPAPRSPLRTHVFDAARRLEVEAARVKRDRLADERDHVLRVLRVAAVEELDVARRVARGLADRCEQAQALGLELRDTRDDVHGRAGLRGHAARDGLEARGVHLVGALVGEVAGKEGRLCKGGGGGYGGGGGGSACTGAGRQGSA